MAEDAKDDLDEAKPAGKSKLVPIMLVMNTLLVAGVLVFTLTRKSSPPPAAAGHDEKTADHTAPAAGDHAAPAAAPAAGHGPPGPTIGPTVPLENFVVQLRAIESERYAHLKLELEVTSDDERQKLVPLLPRMRDAIIGYLADRTADELRGSEGLGRLKEAVLAKLQEIVPGRRIVNVYVTDFIVQ